MIQVLERVEIHNIQKQSPASVQGSIGERSN